MSLRAPRFAVDIAVAFQFLTRLPVPPVTFAPDGLARSVKFFPLVGLAIGSGAALLESLLAPHLGRPASAVVVLLFLSRAVLLAGLPLEHFTAYLISAHVLCRWSTLPLSHYLPPARDSEGQGARIASLTSATSLIIGSVFTIVTVIVALRKAAIAPVLSAIAIPLLSSFFYMRKFGGVTGDCFGATNQLTEIAVYLCGVWTP
jgi:adenosylcobinamide-GDP ribazoletransferase